MPAPLKAQLTDVGDSRHLLDPLPVAAFRFAQSIARARPLLLRAQGGDAIGEIARQLFQQLDLSTLEAAHARRINSQRSEGFPRNPERHCDYAV